MSTPAERAHLRLCEKLAHSTTTHSARSQTDRRWHSMTTQEAIARARNGRKSGPKARGRKAVLHFQSDYEE